MAEGRLRQSHNRLDCAEDIAKFYCYDSRWLALTGPKGKNLMVLAPVFGDERKKIVEGPIPVGFDGYLRLLKGTRRVIYKPSGSISTSEPSHHQPYLVRARNEGNRAGSLRMTCIGSFG